METNTITQADYTELCSALPDNSVDMILTDPPYYTDAKISIVNNKSMQRLGNHNWELPRLNFASDLLRPLKENGTFYIWCGQSEISYLRHDIEATGAKVVSMLVWIKTNPMYSAPKKIYRGGIELCLFGVKGSITKSYFRPDVTQEELLPVRYAPIVAGHERTEHPTQKPVELFKEFILNSTREGEIVLDPFAGSGTTAVACIKTNRRYICGDQSAEYVELARKRIATCDPYQDTPVDDGVTQLSMFSTVAHDGE